MIFQNLSSQQSAEPCYTKLRLGSSVDCINLPSKVNCAAEHERVVFMYLNMYYVAEIQTGDILQEKPTLTVAVRCWMTTWI